MFLLFMQTRRHAVTTRLLFLCQNCLFGNQVLWKFCRMQNLYTLGTGSSASREKNSSLYKNVLRRTVLRIDTLQFSSTTVFFSDSLILGCGKILSHSAALHLCVVEPPPTFNRMDYFCRSITKEYKEDNGQRPNFFAVINTNFCRCC